VLDQTLKPNEIIVVDDGSTDDTGTRLAALGDRIQYIRQTNRGLSGARNTGICQARGEWIALLDADDFWHPQKLERQWNALQSAPDCATMGSQVITFEEELPPAIAARYSGPPPVKQFGLREVVFGISFGSGSGTIIQRRCFEKVGYFDEKLRAVEDLDLWLRIGAEYRMGSVLEPLTFLRVRPNSMSTQAESMEKNHRVVITKAFETIPALRKKFVWKQIALARMHRGVAWMHFEAANRRSALASLWRSFLAWPFTSADSKPLTRVKMAIRYTLTSLWRHSS
jgi:glycosyltransferase involved in cell wall biosynthesis